MTVALRVLIVLMVLGLILLWVTAFAPLIEDATARLLASLIVGTPTGYAAGAAWIAVGDP